MCIICVCNRMLTQDEFDTCEKSNSDGFGFAMLDNTTKSNSIIVKKGYIVNNGYEIYKDTLLLYDTPKHVIHFRLASSGKVMDELTHPFVLDLDILNQDILECSTDAPVLFHNGHLDGWENMLLCMSAQFGCIDGQLSDSKILAWALTKVWEKQGVMGIHAILNNLTDKFVVMLGPVLNTYGYFFQSEDKQVQFSNMSFKNTHQVITWKRGG